MNLGHTRPHDNATGRLPAAIHPLQCFVWIKPTGAPHRPARCAVFPSPFSLPQCWADHAAVGLVRLEAGLPEKAARDHAVHDLQHRRFVGPAFAIGMAHRIEWLVGGPMSAKIDRRQVEASCQSHVELMTPASRRLGVAMQEPDGRPIFAPAFNGRQFPATPPMNGVRLHDACESHAGPCSQAQARPLRRQRVSCVMAYVRVHRWVRRIDDRAADPGEAPCSACVHMVHRGYG